MKIAIVHDYIKEYGGAERVLEALHEMYPKAPIFTLVFCPKFLGPHRERFKSWDIRESWVGLIPFKYKLISPLRLIAPFVFKAMDLSDYDFVIVSATGAYTPNMIRTKKSNKLKTEKHNSSFTAHSACHICYSHTPPRYLYGYATAREWKKNGFIRILALIANHFLRLIDFQSSQNVDIFIANSQNVAARIKKFYRRDSVVIYPPVEMSVSSEKKRKNETKGNYYLAGGRLARPKHIDLIIKTCTRLGVPLKVFGRGFAGYEEELRGLMNDKNPIIELVGEVTDQEKIELMRNAYAYIFAGEDEDFGMLPVEAMSIGTPVVAYRSGGVVESIVEGKTGIFFDELSEESLGKAIKRFEQVKNSFLKAMMIREASKFSKDKFVKGISKVILEAKR